MRTLLFALLAVVLSPSLAHAGGSKLAQLLVKNENSVTPNGSKTPNIELLAVFLDVNPEDLDLSGLHDLASIVKAARVLGPKGIASYPDVRVGVHTIYAFYIPIGPIGSFDLKDVHTSSTQVNVQRGTTTVHVRGNSSGGPIFSTNGSP